MSTTRKQMTKCLLQTRDTASPFLQTVGVFEATFMKYEYLNVALLREMCHGSAIELKEYFNFFFPTALHPCAGLKFSFV